IQRSTTSTATTSTARRNHGWALPSGTLAARNDAKGLMTSSRTVGQTSSFQCGRSAMETCSSSPNSRCGIPVTPRIVPDLVAAMAWRASADGDDVPGSHDFGPTRDVDHETTFGIDVHRFAFEYARPGQ